jgi:hypothetical protein
MRVAAPRPNTLQLLQSSDQPPQRLVVEAIADFYPASVGQQHRQRARLIPSAYRTHGCSQFYLDQRTPTNTIGVAMLLLLLFLQVTIQCAQCHAMTTAERTAPQPARSVQTRHPRNLRATATINYPY